MAKNKVIPKFSVGAYIITAIILVAIIAGTYFIFKDTQTTPTDSNENIITEPETENTTTEITTTSPSEDTEPIENTADTSTENTENNLDSEPEIPVEDTTSEHDTDSLIRSIILYRSFVNEIRPVLSSEAKSSLDLIDKFIQNDPSLLSNDPQTYPEEIKSAIEIVKNEAKQKLGTLAFRIKSPEDKSTDDLIGDMVKERGIIELHDNSTDNAFAKIYKITNEEGLIYYFTFGELKSTEADKLLGQTADITFKIVKIDDENRAVLYDITHGPKLFEEEEKEKESKTSTTE